MTSRSSTLFSHWPCSRSAVSSAIACSASRVLIHKNIPIRSIGVEIMPAYYEDYLKKQYPRDIEELTLTYPIETVRGRYGGGVRMADWYFQDRPKLTPKQTALLKRLAIGLHGEDLDEMNRILTHFAS